MKNLILVRHAKSSWDVPMQDKSRGITCQGIINAHLVSNHVKHLIPNTYIMCSSTAKRAKNTALIFAQNFSYPVESINFSDELYTFDEQKLEEIIKSLSKSYENVILFGHNGAITDFVNKFGDQFIENVPTSGFVSIEFETDSWTDIKKGKVKYKIFPKQLR
ncbi:SixA phosphatase family protein [Flavobacterium weaverense]|uniref:Phosphohistidine phosphatase n=1 Tax=Flavobacterium weaverense TaxID=271156 RepID=A0A3L9ZI21_9FLAO|nr:phosphoglycerate mutase family protein [Flavobacterium weaverense]RMA71607.1 phosphohistidine phosphatase [Flavobacterium weaverense]